MYVKTLLSSLASCALVMFPLAFCSLGCSDDDEQGALRVDKECSRIACREEGFCSFDSSSGRCLPRGGDCSQTNSCQEQGWCSAVTLGVSPSCRASSAADCQRSVQCKSQGVCGYRGNGVCEQDPQWSGTPSCADSMSCLREGRCAGSYPSCEIDDAGCARSLACKSRGACAQLSQVKMVCAPATKAHCTNSDGCVDAGICGFIEGVPACVLGTDADCRASWACRDHGACTLGKTKCEVTSSDDCAASYGCLYHGKCKLVGDLAAGTSECG